MLFYDEVQMQVTKTVEKVPLLHGHRHEVVDATGRSCRRWHFAPDCPARQSNAALDRQRFAPSPINVVLHRTPHLVDNRVEVGAVGRLQIGSNARRNLSLCVTRPSHGPMSRWVHCAAEKWRSRQKLHRYRAASPVSAACPDNTLHAKVH